MPSWPLSSTLVKPTTCAAASPSGYWRLYSLHLVDALEVERRATGLATLLVDLALAARRSSGCRRGGRLELRRRSCRAACASCLRCSPASRVDVLRDRPDRRRRHARGQQQAVAVDDAAAAGRQLERVARSAISPWRQEEVGARSSARRRRGRAAPAKPRPTAATRSLQRQSGVLRREQRAGRVGDAAHARRERCAPSAFGLSSRRGSWRRPGRLPRPRRRRAGSSHVLRDGRRGGAHRRAARARCFSTRSGVACARFSAFRRSRSVSSARSSLVRLVELGEQAARLVAETRTR